MLAVNKSPAVYHPRSTDFEEKSQVTLAFFPHKSELKKTTALQLNSLMFEFEILTFLQGLNDLEYKKPKKKTLIEDAELHS